MWAFTTLGESYMYESRVLGMHTYLMEMLAVLVQREPWITDIHATSYAAYIC